MFQTMQFYGPNWVRLFIHEAKKLKCALDDKDLIDLNNLKNLPSFLLLYERLASSGFP